MELLFHIEKTGNSDLHVGLFMMSEWPCLLLNAADDRIIMIMRTDCKCVQQEARAALVQHLISDLCYVH